VISIILIVIELYCTLIKNDVSSVSCLGSNIAGPTRI